MKNLRIKIPKNISKKKVLEYFLRKNFSSFLQIKKENKIGDVRSLIPGAVLKIQKKSG